MATPQPPYHHPGPSNYHQHHPPPYAYGTHSPAPPPGHAPYQYQYPMPPVNGHGQPMHASSSARGRGYLPPRGGQNYQNYHHRPSPHHHYPYPSHTPHYPPPHSHPHNKYPHSNAQSVPYSPTYATHPSATYPPAWQPQQPLSPLPKQLSMLTQLSSAFNQPSLQGDSALPSPNDETPKPDADQPADTITKQETPEKSDIQLEASQPPSVSPPPSPAVPQGAIASPVLPSSTHASSPATLSPLVPVKEAEYVIWSRRPTDPSGAPGIIISPRARPPDHIRRKALDLPSPPFPVLPREALQQPSVEPQPEDVDMSSTSVPETAKPEPVDMSSISITETAKPETVDISSASATETTTAASSAVNTSVPTSPISTNTSISLAITSPPTKMGQDSLSVHVATPQVDSVPLSSDPVLDAIPEPTLPAPSSTPSTPSQTSKPPTGPRPSFASLLRRDNFTPSKPNALPRSSVVGISIPASTPSVTSNTSSISLNKKPELLSLLMSGPSNSPLMKIYPRGLVNTGNMCFANAVLQVLVYCPPFWRLFYELGKVMDKSPDTVTGGEQSRTPLVDTTVRFIREFIPKQKKATAPEGKGKAVDRTAYGEEEDDVMESFIPAYVYDALKEKKRFDHMRGGHQEDAEEFLGFYLDTLEEELLSITASLQSKNANDPGYSERQQNGSAAEDGPWLEVGKKNRTAVTRTVNTTESPITRIFGGKFRSTLRVPHQKDSIIFEDWRSLRLDIQRDQVHTLKDALSCISTPQSVQVTSVTKPGAVLDAKQIVQIETLPPILVLHLKRFLYDANAGGTAKVGKQVLFDAELEVGSDVMAPGRKIQTTRYKLFGVLYHHGTSASGGHYTLDVLHPNIAMNPTKPREGWIRIDDELVSDVSPEDVFGTHARDDRCAYLLFYRRVGGGGGGART
ncbi:hypothetical protein F5J12DRAFT_862832 [Pisolithus orientalis]|uniref:uncharacterized protein n=1 Tax=Pisolithus orientalis TaxID=936130 RepID=UPI00222574DD|nr:uncharacterized protein F5J12DRAFT_862832 [Pisolithus orientalis]KAI5990559.1 hypothetical protein F5J12DRAFT_862832 [Pisolithus orientalis]